MDHARVDIQMHEATIVRLTTETSHSQAKSAAEKVQSHARRFAPVRTGRLRESIRVTLVRQTTFECTYMVGSDLEYAKYQEEGTGPIYAGPRGVLVFKIGGATIYAKHTRGVPATHFMAKAAAEMKAADFLTSL